MVIPVHAHFARVRSSAIHYLTDLQYVALSKDAFPTTPACVAGRIKSIRLPKQAQVSSVSFQAQYQAFVRFAVRSGAAFQSRRAQRDLRFGTFHSGRALALRTLASNPCALRGQQPWTDVGNERSRSKGIFQVVFLRSNRALSGRLPARYRPRNTCQVGPCRPFQH
jgi:hypothetical protein